MTDEVINRTDEELAQAVQSGDHVSFAELMRRYEDRLIRYGRRFLSRDEDIEDVVQDVFLKTYENIQSYDISYRFSPWVYRIAHNAFVNVLRKHSRRSFELFDFDTLVSPFGHKAIQDEAIGVSEAELEKYLKTLSPKYREVLILHYFEDMSYDEIADVLHVPIGTVGVRLKRAREVLKKIYSEQQTI